MRDGQKVEALLAPPEIKPLLARVSDVEQDIQGRINRAGAAVNPCAMTRREA